MEDRKKFITFILVIAVWYIGVNLYLKSRFPKQPEQPNTENVQSEEEHAGQKPNPAPVEQTPEEQPTQNENIAPEKTEPEDTALTEKPEKPVAETPEPEPKEILKEETVIIETGDTHSGYTVTLSNRGAVINRLVLKDYFKDKNRPDEKLLLLSSEITGKASLALGTLSITKEKNGEFITSNVEGLNTRLWKTVSQNGKKAVFETNLSPGVTLRKAVSFNTEFQGFDIILSLVNTTESPVEAAFSLTGSPGVIPEYDLQKDRALKALISVKKDSGKADTDSHYFKSLKDKIVEKDEGEFQWIAGTNKYFTVLLKHEENAGCVPVITGKASAIYPSPENTLQEKDYNGETIAEIRSFSAEKQNTGEIKFSFHAIPIRKDELIRAGVEYREVISLGMIDWLGELFLAVLSLIHKVLPNWGLSIILFTILVNIVMFPLNKKSQISMHKMQKLQPELKKLQKAHKGNKQKLNAEMMKLYHKHGVNPLGGCLPMLLQLPIFIGIFYSLRGSFALRQSAFLWMNDLSLPDALFALPFSAFPTFNLLPFIMAIATFIQQKFSSPKNKPEPGKQEDMQQSMQSAMKIMPWIMLFIFYKFPAGLLLYWSTNSILRIFETYHIKHKLLAEPAAESGKEE